MRKLIRSLLLASVVAGGTAGLVTLTPAIAQTGKDKTDPKTKVDPKPAEVKGAVVYRQGKDEKWRFFVEDADGKMLAMSKAYDKKEDCVKAIDAVKALLTTAKPMEEPKGK
jgi:uncharacterized protein YegP (UPF0339 family)